MSRLGTKHRPHVPKTTAPWATLPWKRELRRHEIHEEQQDLAARAAQSNLLIPKSGQVSGMLSRLARAGRRRV